MSDDPAPRNVPIVIAGDPDPRATEATLRDLFADLSGEISLDVEVAPEVDPRSITDPPGAPAPAFARVWIEVRSHTCVVSVADTTWERIYQRRIPRPADNDEVTREQAAQVVVSALEALLSGGTIGVSRASLTPPSPPPPPVGSAPKETPPEVTNERRPGAMLVVGYEALAFSPSTIAHGPVALLRGALQEGAWSAGIALSAQWRTPLVVEEAPIGVRLDTRSFRLSLEGARAISRSTTLHAGFGPGLDFTAIEPRGVSHGGDAGEPVVTVEATRSRVTPVLRWSLGLDVRPSRGLHVALAGVLDHALANRSYVVRRQGVERDVLAPFDVRPGLVLTIGADLVRP